MTSGLVTWWLQQRPIPWWNTITEIDDNTPTNQQRKYKTTETKCLITEIVLFFFLCWQANCPLAGRKMQKNKTRTNKKSTALWRRRPAGSAATGDTRWRVRLWRLPVHIYTYIYIYHCSLYSHTHTHTQNRYDLHTTHSTRTTAAINRHREEAAVQRIYERELLLGLVWPNSAYIHTHTQCVCVWRYWLKKDKKREESKDSRYVPPRNGVDAQSCVFGSANTNWFYPCSECLVCACGPCTLDPV